MLPRDPSSAKLTAWVCLKWAPKESNLASREAWDLQSHASSQDSRRARPFNLRDPTPKSKRNVRLPACLAVEAGSVSKTSQSAHRREAWEVR